MKSDSYGTPLLDRKQLHETGERRQLEYQGNVPFPHVVVDGLIDMRIIERVGDEFPGPEDIPWNQKTHEYSRKLACEDMSLMGPWTRLLLYEMNGGVFIRFLEMLTGITGILPDPHLKGGGLHQIEAGGFLDVHADFNYHEGLNLQRRLNVLLYLNRDWKEEYGGHLELWNEKLDRCEKRIAPIANRMVVFNTTDTSYHGHPEPVSCPEWITRNSLALYYYTTESPGSERSASHSTLYRSEIRHARRSLRQRIKAGLRRLIEQVD